MIPFFDLREFRNPNRSPDPLAAVEPGDLCAAWRGKPAWRIAPADSESWARGSVASGFAPLAAAAALPDDPAARIAWAARILDLLHPQGEAAFLIRATDAYVVEADPPPGCYAESSALIPGHLAVFCAAQIAARGGCTAAIPAIGEFDAEAIGGIAAARVPFRANPWDWNREAARWRALAPLLDPGAGFPASLRLQRPARLRLDADAGGGKIDADLSPWDQAGLDFARLNPIHRRLAALDSLRGLRLGDAARCPESSRLLRSFLSAGQIDPADAPAIARALDAAASIAAPLRAAEGAARLAYLPDAAEITLACRCTPPGLPASAFPAGAEIYGRTYRRKFTRPAARRCWRDGRAIDARLEGSGRAAELRAADGSGTVLYTEAAAFLPKNALRRHLAAFPLAQLPDHFDLPAPEPLERALAPRIAGLARQIQSWFPA